MDLEIKARLRPIAREKAAWFSEEIKKAVGSTENPHQASIDLNDQVEAFVATLPENEREIFIYLYTEELNANTAAMNDKTEALRVETDLDTANAASAISIVLAVIVFFVLIVVFSR